MSKKLTSLILILASILAFQNNIAQVLADQDSRSQIKMLSKSSEIIVVGKVISKESFWNKDKSRIFTNVSIEAEEYLKGASSSRLTITVPGGEIGEIGEIYTHLPKFDDQEEMILFVRRDKKNQLRITGGELGKIELIRDDKTGEKLTASNKSVEIVKNEIRLYSEQ